MIDKHRTLLILGGTAEARALAGAVTDAHPELDVVTSLAGATSTPADLAGRVRTGGFGGKDGLKRFLVDDGIAMVVDATHPFAAHITQNAVTACAEAGVPYLRLDRPPWTPPDNTDVVFVPDTEEAARLVARTSTAAFLTIGTQGLAAFQDIGKVKLVARVMAEPEPDARIAGIHYVVDRPPFDVAGEEALMRAHGIDTLVTKASGGDATRAKLDAAARIGARVIMVRRPPPPSAPCVATCDDALIWIGVHL